MANAGTSRRTSIRAQSTLCLVVHVALLLVHVGTLYLVSTDLNCSSVASVRTPVGSKCVRLTLNPASDRY